MLDIQNTPDTREIPLQKVGVKNVRYPVQVLDKNAKYAIIEGNELLKYICEKEGTKIEDLTLNLLNNY